MAISGLSEKVLSKLKQLKTALLKNDNDGKITKSELSEFISKKEDVLQKNKISTKDATQELKSLLKEDYVGSSASVSSKTFSTSSKKDNKTDKTQNGKIDSYKEGDKSNHMFLVGLNSLAATKEGADVIKNSIKKEKDGNFTISFNGINQEIKITVSELESAQKKGKYSKGDSDVILMELAFEKILNMTKKGEIQLPKNVKRTSVASAATLLVGTSQIEIRQKDIQNGIDPYKDIQGNPNNVAAAIKFQNDKTYSIEDVNGKQVKFSSDYYSVNWNIVKVDNNTVTIQSPKDSSKIYTFEKKDIEKYIYKISCTNLKDLAQTNEEIDAFKQGKEGDCWLLAGLNAFQQTQGGRDIIKDVMEQNKNGSYSVKIAGQYNYTISQAQIAEARADKARPKGDDDVIILELAMEQFLIDVKNDKIKLPEDSPIQKSKIKDDSPVSGHNTNWLSYLLTGKTCQKYENLNKDVEIVSENNREKFNKNTYLELAKNPDSYAATISIGTSEGDASAPDMNGDIIKLAKTGHSLTILKVNLDENGNPTTVVLANPWDSENNVHEFKIEDLEKITKGIYMFNTKS